MERAGEKLKRIRERLNLTFRDVEQASQQIAGRMGNPEFIIALSRLADIENKGTVPTIYRLYTLCAIYRLDFAEILAWYGAPLDRLASRRCRSGSPRRTRWRSGLEIKLRIGRCSPTAKSISIRPHSSAT